MERVQTQEIYELPLDALRRMAPEIVWSHPPTVSPHLSPTEVSHLVGEWYVTQSKETHRHHTGQFFTPPSLARYMAHLSGTLPDQARVLDPGAGVGMLATAICEVAFRHKVSTLSIVAYESDPLLAILCLFTLNYAHDWLRERGIDASITVHQRDFIEAMADHLTQISLWSSDPQPQQPFDLAILNPPYLKVNQKDARTQLIKDVVHGRTNMYTMFMSLAASSLRPGGRFVSITPRSFASGAYFKHFRSQFFGAITPEIIHLFDSRRAAFEDADVLQENIILAGSRKSLAIGDSPSVIISQSQGIHDLASAHLQHIPRQLIVEDKQEDPILHLPTSDIDTHLLQAFRCWNNVLATYGLEISTGPVVPFRIPHLLTSVESVQQRIAVPLLWLQHIRRLAIQWPLEHFGKPQGVLNDAGPKFLVKNKTQVVLRRFSAKEEPRRITAAVLAEEAFGTEWIALENHLNYLYRIGGELSYEEAVGVAAFLNSSLVDRYFRITSGNTQVSATELRKLPLPPWERLTCIGKRVVSLPSLPTEHDFYAIECIIMEELGEDLMVGSPEDLQLPVLQDSRILMGKIQEAQRILGELGLPPAQQNEISALTLLALCSLRETISWANASRQPITIHNMMGFMKQHYGRAYAENTREVVRRQVIHQFEQARLVDRNPDDHSRSTNSPHTCYALTKEALTLLTQFGTATWESAVIHFLEQHGTLLVQYQRSCQSIALPLKLTDGMIHYNGEKFLGPLSAT